MKKINSKQLAILSLVLIIATLGLSYYHQKKKSQPAPTATEFEHSIPPRPADFQESVTSFLATIRLMRIATHDNDLEKFSFYQKDLLALWRDTINEFINTPPSDIEAETWQKTLSEIYEKLQASEKIAKAPADAIILIDQCQAMLLEISDPKNHFPEENQLYLMYKATKNLSSASSSAEALLLLPDLKLSYTAYKELTESARTYDQNKYFESVLSDIENATETTFPKELAKLEPAFFEIYRNF